jgi:hypothetical protein
VIKSRPLDPGIGTNDIHWTEQFMCLRASLDVLEKRNVSCPCWE